MKQTQRLVIILGEDSLITKATVVIAGFKACSVIKHFSEENIYNVFKFNKNAVYFSKLFDIQYFSHFNPILIYLTKSKSNFDKNYLNINNIINDFPIILNTFNIDSGDHISEDSENNDSTINNTCLFCNSSDKSLRHIKNIVYESNNFYVLPGSGAFFNGYLMIIPKNHITSFALLSEEKMKEFYIVFDVIRNMLCNIYNYKIFAFECGSGKSGTGKHKTSIVHAHFHLAPTDMPVLREIQKSGLNPSLIDKRSLNNYGKNPYMLYIDQEDNWYISSDTNIYYPRQHPRQVLAEYMNDYEHYNWRIYPYYEKMDEIANEFRNFCRKEYYKFPKWIQNNIRFED